KKHHLPPPNPGYIQPPIAYPGDPFPEYLQKTMQIYTLFQKSHFKHDLRQTGLFPLSYKTLIDAIGRRNSRGLGGSRVMRKRRAVSKIRIPARDLM
ncbi:MAG: hypothetical protein MUP41_08010, partial [Desulfobacterales bacterium]|nr:hypothetical protein [Desulfobacterales bacterium]